MFAGPADGGSGLKEIRDAGVINSKFSQRYPLWHAEKFSLVGLKMDVITRTPVWNASDGRIKDG